MTPPQGRRYPGLTSGNVKAGSGGGFRLLLGLLGRLLRPVLGLLSCLALGLLLRLGLLLLLLQGLLVGLDDLAVADLAAPALDLVLFEQRARHHVALDVLEVEAEAAALRAPEVGGLLAEAVRVVLGDEEAPGHRRRDLVERDRAVGVALGALGLPDEPLVRNLLDDRGLPGAVG